MMEIVEAVAAIKKALKDDPELYYTWQSAIAMNVYAQIEKLPAPPTSLHEVSNKAAKGFLDMLINTN